MTRSSHRAPDAARTVGRGRRRAGPSALAALGLALLGVAGCRHRPPPGPHAAVERDLQRLERIARRDLDCASVRVVPLRAEVFQVDGCGRLSDYALACTGRRCEWLTVPSAASHAARDLSCPPELTVASAPSPTRREFAGCGSRIAYSITCGLTTCGWMPAEARASAEPAAPRPTDAGGSGEGDVISIPARAVEVPPAATTADEEGDVAIPAPPRS